MSVEAAESRPVASRVLVAVFVVICVSIFGFLWTNSGGRVPLVSQSGYEVTVEMPSVANTVYFSDVMMAGVKVGKVRDVEIVENHARLVLELDESVAPLHDEATFAVRAKTLVEESYIEVSDGGEREVESGHAYDLESAEQVVQLDDVLNSLDEPTRDDLAALLQASGLATEGSRDDVAAALEGVGHLGREGEDAISALAAQSADLEQLTHNANQLMLAMADRRTQLSTLAEQAAALLEVTSGQSADLAAVMTSLPPLIGSAGEATDDLATLAGLLDPVTTNLQASAQPLSTALQLLPSLTTDLRGLLPDLDAVLVDAPPTLNEIPNLSSQLISLVPPTSALLADANPVLGYLEPYGRDLSAFFANFAQTLATGDANGRIFRVMMVLNEQSFKGYPLSTNIGLLDKFNALPGAGTLDNPGPARPEYPRIEREPIP